MSTVWRNGATSRPASRSAATRKHLQLLALGALAQAPCGLAQVVHRLGHGRVVVLAGGRERDLPVAAMQQLHAQPLYLGSIDAPGTLIPNH